VASCQPLLMTGALRSQVKWPCCPLRQRQPPSPAERSALPDNPEADLAGARSPSRRSFCFPTAPQVGTLRAASSWIARRESHGFATRPVTGTILSGVPSTGYANWRPASLPLERQIVRREGLSIARVTQILSRLGAPMAANEGAG
jgi:hypothetical protein